MPTYCYRLLKEPTFSMLFASFLWKFLALKDSSHALITLDNLVVLLFSDFPLSFLVLQQRLILDFLVLKFFKFKFFSFCIISFFLIPLNLIFFYFFNSLFDLRSESFFYFHYLTRFTFFLCNSSIQSFFLIIICFHQFFNLFIGLELCQGL